MFLKYLEFAEFVGILVERLTILPACFSVGGQEQ